MYSKQKRDEKVLKVRSKYEFSPGLHTVLHYPQRVQICHQPHALKPKSIKVRSKYEFTPGLHTVFHYPQKIVLKHYVYVNTSCVIIPYEIIKEFDVVHHL